MSSAWQGHTNKHIHAHTSVHTSARHLYLFAAAAACCSPPPPCKTARVVCILSRVICVRAHADVLINIQDIRQGAGVLGTCVQICQQARKRVWITSLNNRFLCV